MKLIIFIDYVKVMYCFIIFFCLVCQQHVFFPTFRKNFHSMHYAPTSAYLCLAVIWYISNRAHMFSLKSFIGSLWHLLGL